MAVVLVVDDDAGIRECLAEILEVEGFDVLQACNGREALRVLDGCRPAVIILDLMMPVMSGWQFREEQKRRPNIADVPVVVITADNQPDIDADRIFSKPFKMDELIREVDEIVAAASHADLERL